MSLKPIAVIGSIFMDCKGFARDTYMPTGRNLGHIQFVHGGVGRNVAENLALLDLPVQFVSTVDTTSLGQEIMKRLKQSGVDTQYVGETNQGGMGMWLAILDQQGDLAGSISQMQDLGLLQQSLQKHGEAIVRGAGHLALELDLNADISRHILELAAANSVPVYGIPGNLDVVLNNRDLLRSVDCFICNHLEAERLFGEPLDPSSPDAVIAVAQKHREQAGLNSIVVTLGSLGSVYIDANTGESGFQPVFPVTVVDSSGAGDAFFSGTVMGLARSLPLRQAVVCGTKVAGWTIGSKENNCAELPAKIKEDALFQSMFAPV